MPSVRLCALVLFGTLFVLFLLGGCATTKATSIVTDTFCAVAKPIRLSRQDILTDDTRRQIIEHNRVGMAQCAWH